MIRVSRFCEKKFTKDTKNAYEINERVLKKIININKNTEIGRKYGFSKIRKVEDFKIAVALATYDDYREYVARMCRGEKNILTKEQPQYYGITSGTTGNQKLIPVTKTSYNAVAEYMAILPQRFLYNNFKDKWTYERGLVLTDMNITDYTEKGVPICGATSGGMRSIKSIIPLIWTTPVEVMNVKNYDSALYLHLFFALKERNLMSISGVFISSILDLFRYLEKNYEQLVSDVRRGRINRNILMDKNIRKVLSDKLEPETGRADFLDKEFKKGFKGIARRIWPNLIYINCVTGGNFSIYDYKVAQYTDNLPVYSSIYAATEATIGINKYIDKQRYVIIPRTAFFEFIPVCNMYDKNPKTKNIKELNIGEEYEIVVTSFCGLYRYRIGDVIKVVGYFNNSPEIEFLYRKNQLLNMVSEKTTENHVLKAINNTIKLLRNEFLDYTVMPDNSVSPGRYVFYIEPKKNLREIKIEEVSNVLDRELCKSNLAYGRQRCKGKLQRVQIRIVKRGTFALLKKMAVDKGVSKSQFKVPRVLKNKYMIEFMKRRVE